MLWTYFTSEIISCPQSHRATTLDTCTVNHVRWHIRIMANLFSTYRLVPCLAVGTCDCCWWDLSNLPIYLRLWLAWGRVWCDWFVAGLDTLVLWVWCCVWLWAVDVLATDPLAELVWDKFSEIVDTIKLASKVGSLSITINIGLKINHIVETGSTLWLLSATPRCKLWLLIISQQPWLATTYSVL